MKTNKIIAVIAVALTLAGAALLAKPASAGIPRDFDGHNAYGAGQRMEDPTVCETLYFDHDNIPAVAGNEGPQRVVRASWYGNQFHTQQNSSVPSGGQMANGEYFHECDATVVAHKSLPKGTVLRMTNVSNGLTLMVVVQDRGPYAPEDPHREIDMSRGAAQHLGIIGSGAGVANVQIEILGTP